VDLQTPNSSQASADLLRANLLMQVASQLASVLKVGQCSLQHPTQGQMRTDASCLRLNARLPLH